MRLLLTLNFRTDSPGTGTEISVSGNNPIQMREMNTGCQVKKFSTDQRRVRKLASKKHEVFCVSVARIGRRAFNCEACQSQWLSDRFFDPATNLCSRGFFKHVCGRFNSRIGVDPAGARWARNGALPHCHSRGVGKQVLKRHPRIGSGRTQGNEASGDRNQC